MEVRLLKVRLLDNVSRPELTGTKGQILALDSKLAEDLEAHGYASYDLAVEESDAPTPEDETEGSEAEDTTAKNTRRKASRK